MLIFQEFLLDVFINSVSIFEGNDTQCNFNYRIISIEIELNEAWFGGFEIYWVSINISSSVLW